LPAYKKTPGGSYSRKCVFCGRWIQMRNMGGHYVPWEGESPHECQHPPANTKPLWVWPEARVSKEVATPSRPPGIDLPEFRAFQLRRKGALPSPVASIAQSASAQASMPTASPRPSRKGVESVLPASQAKPSGRAGWRGPVENGAVPQERANERFGRVGAERSTPSRGSFARPLPRPMATPMGAASVSRGSRRRSFWPWVLAGAGLVVLIAVLQARPTASTSAAPTGGSCPAGFPVKGNISGADRIYHVPGGQFYVRTLPEACFKDASAAEAAGYRRSQR